MSTRPSSSFSRTLSHSRLINRSSYRDFIEGCNQDFFSQDSTIQDALKALDLEDIDDTIPGMAITLMPHQLIGVAWMVRWLSL